MRSEAAIWRLAVASAIAMVVGVAATPANAAIISAYELIEDVQTTYEGTPGGTSRDLSRTRSDSTGTTTIGSTPAEETTIATQNNLSASFGLHTVGANNTGDDVTYTHWMDWIVPPETAYLSAVLTIMAYDVQGNNDAVFSDTVDIGDLTGGVAVDTVTTSIFTDAVLVAQLIDDRLNISINFSNGDEINVFSSRLDVRYEDGNNPPDPAPEPMTLTMLGFGLLGVAYGARKRHATRR